MAKGNSIIVSAEPKGVFTEGIVTGTPKPGTVMQIDVSEAEVGGRWTWEAFTQADGVHSPIAVLLEDMFIGNRLATTAYVAGDRVQLYFPVMGEELNMLVADVAGTGADQDHTIGERFIVDSGTGKLIATTGSPESEPFICLEALTDQTADQLLRCMYTGY